MKYSELRVLPLVIIFTHCAINAQVVPNWWKITHGLDSTITDEDEVEVLDLDVLVGYGNTS